MDEAPIFQVNPHVIRNATLPATARLEKYQISFLQFGTTHFLAIILQHIRRGTSQLLSVYLPINDRYETGAIHAPFRAPSQFMTYTQPTGPLVVQEYIIFRVIRTPYKRANSFGPLKSAGKATFCCFLLPHEVRHISRIKIRINHKGMLFFISFSLN